MAVFLVKLNHDCNGRLNKYAQEMLKDGCLTDCVLKSLIDNDHSDEIECHSLILCAYSEYFQRCFAKRIISKAHDSVKIVCLDFRTTILQYLIKLIYFGQCSVLEIDILDLQTALARLKIDHSLSSNGQTIHQDSKNNSNQLKRRLTTEPVNEYNLQNDSLNDISVERTLMSQLPLNGDSLPDMLETNDNQADDSRYVCQICNKVYQYVISLNKHLKTAHRTQ